MAGRPLVAVLILSWNESDFTVKCVKDLKACDYPNLKIMVLDNGSRKEESEKLRRIGGIELLKSDKNLGFTGGNNYLIRQTMKKKSVKYLICLNNDTRLERDFLSRLVEVAEDNPKFGCLGPLIFDKSGNISIGDHPGDFNLYMGGSSRIRRWKNKIRSKPFISDYISGCCMMFSRKLMERIGGFPENYFIYNEEVEICYRIKKEGFLCCVVPQSKITHLVSATTGKISGFKQYHQFRNIIWFEKMYGNLMEKIVFFAYLFAFKTPKRVVLNVLEGNANSKNHMLIKGILEGMIGT